MKIKKHFKIAAVMTTMCAGLLFPVAAYAAQEDEVPAYTEKEVPVFRKSLSEKETFTCYFFEDMPNVPYVDYQTYAKTFYKINLTLTDLGSGKYTVTKKSSDGKIYYAALDTNAETFAVDDPGNFFAIAEQDESTGNGRSEDYPFVKNTINIDRKGTLQKKLYDFDKNGIDIRTVNEQPAFPLASLSDIYGCSGAGYPTIYNGEKIYFYGLSELLDCGMVRDTDFTLIQPLIDGNRSKDMSEFVYKELCFVLENEYGYPDPTIPFAKKMKEEGLDAALTELDPKTKEFLLSSDPVEYIAGLNRLLAIWLDDGGHTGVGLMELMSAVGGEEANVNLEKNTAFLNTILGNQDNNIDWKGNANLINHKRSVEKAKAKATYPAIRAEAYGIGEDRNQGVIYKGDTAVIFFNEFTIDTQGWKEYYNNVDAGKEGAIPQDTYGFFQTAMREISTHPEIKNVVIDDSLNGGGIDVTLLGVEDLLYGKNYKVSLNQKTGITSTISVVFDRNLDGKFDEKDTEVDYSKYNYAVLTSQYSFSCGNLLPAFSKEQGIMIMGETSGGGCCSVGFYTTADGLTYHISSSNKYLSPAAVEGILDKGVAPDVQMSFTDNAYDIDAMSKAIAEFYRSKTTYKNEWVEGKWYGQDGKSTYKYKGSWKKNSKGWWFEDETGWYPKNQWQKIDGKWYFFNAAGYMEKNAYRNGYYLTSSGAWDGKAAVTGWRKSGNGWWYSLGGNDYIKTSWSMIDGKWYYFQEAGYMVHDAFVQGYWLGSTGAMTDFARCTWHKNSKGWWYGNANGWYAKADYYIDGKSYNFNNTGYMVVQ